MRALKLGEQLLGRYEVFARHFGGMGIVYFVEDMKSHQECSYYAVKTPAKQEFFKKFVDEVRIWLDVPAHPNIVKAHFLEIADRQPYLFMEYVEGYSLRDLIGHLEVEQAIRLAYQVAIGMGFVNQRQQKVVHGDLKPENILVSQDGVAKITDFGVSSLLDFGTGRFPRSMAGTIPYMSPEQLRGEVIDERSDIFSYGIVFYEMLTGQLPYPFETRGLNPSQWRIQLENFYKNIDFYADIYYRAPWREIHNPTIDNRLRDLVWGCIYPYRYNRWESFQEIRKAFEYETNSHYQLGQKIETMGDLHQKALSLYRIGRLSEALNVFNQALFQNPNNAKLWRDAAIACADANRLSEAYQFIARAKQLDSDIEINDPRLGKTADDSTLRRKTKCPNSYE